MKACSLELPYLISPKNNKDALVRLRNAVAGLDEYKDFPRSKLNVVSSDKVKELFHWVETEEFSGQERVVIEHALTGILGVKPTALTDDQIRLNADYIATGLFYGLNRAVELRASQLGGKRDEASKQLIGDIFSKIEILGLPEEEQEKLAQAAKIGRFSQEEIDLRLCRIWARLLYPSLALDPQKMLDIVTQAKQDTWTPEALDNKLQAEKAEADNKLNQKREEMENLLLIRISLLEARGFIREARKQNDESKLDDAEKSIQTIQRDIEALNIKNEKFLKRFEELKEQHKKATFEVFFEKAKAKLRDKDYLSSLQLHAQVMPYDEATNDKLAQLRSNIEKGIEREFTQNLEAINGFLNEENFESAEKKIDEESEALDGYEKYEIIIEGHKHTLNELKISVEKQKEVAPIVKRLVAFAMNPPSVDGLDFKNIRNAAETLEQVGTDMDAFNKAEPSVKKAFLLRHPELNIGNIKSESAALQEELNKKPKSKKDVIEKILHDLPHNIVDLGTLFHYVLTEKKGILEPETEEEKYDELVDLCCQCNVEEFDSIPAQYIILRAAQVKEPETQRAIVLKPGKLEILLYDGQAIEFPENRIAIEVEKAEYDDNKMPNAVIFKVTVPRWLPVIKPEVRRRDLANWERTKHNKGFQIITIIRNFNDKGKGTDRIEIGEHSEYSLTIYPFPDDLEQTKILHKRGIIICKAIVTMPVQRRKQADKPPPRHRHLSGIPSPYFGYPGSIESRLSHAKWMNNLVSADGDTLFVTGNMGVGAIQIRSKSIEELLISK